MTKEQKTTLAGTFYYSVGFMALFMAAMYGLQTAVLITGDVISAILWFVLLLIAIITLTAASIYFLLTLAMIPTTKKKEQEKEKTEK